MRWTCPVRGAAERPYDEDRLKEHADRLWSEGLSGKSASYMTTAARALQDEIPDGRGRNPLVFDAVFKHLGL